MGRFHALFIVSNKFLGQWSSFESSVLLFLAYHQLISTCFSFSQLLVSSSPRDPPWIVPKGYSAIYANGRSQFPAAGCGARYRSGPSLACAYRTQWEKSSTYRFNSSTTLFLSIISDSVLSTSTPNLDTFKVLIFCNVVWIFASLDAWI